jgi:glucose 1-dehydrogenase
VARQVDWDRPIAEVAVQGRFTGKACIVTGAAAGIGRATGLRLGQEGAHVLVADLDGDGAHQVAGEAGEQSFAVQADVSVSSQVTAIVAAAVERFGRVDVLVSNAAMMSFTHVVDTDEQVWRQVLDTNLTAAFLLAKTCLPHMRDGAIVNVSSVHAHRSTPGVAPYAASKAALEALTRALALECTAHNVRVNAVVPGAVDTSMLWSNPNLASGVEQLDGPVGHPEDVAAAIAFLAAEESRFINGATLLVDGGRLAAL